MNIKERINQFANRTKTITIDEFYEVEESKGEKFDDYLEGKIAPLIGMTAIVFNSLESGLDYILSDLVDKYNDDIGWVVIKSMSYAQKVELLIDLMHSDEDTFKEFSISDISELRDSLRHCGNLRNRIIHGEWESHSVENKVKTKLKVNTGGVVFQMTEFKYSDLLDDVEFVDELSLKLWTHEKFQFKKRI